MDDMNWIIPMLILALLFKFIMTICQVSFSSGCSICSDDKLQCIVSYSGYYPSSENSCCSCSSGCQFCSSSSICTQCITRYYLSGSSCDSYSSNCPSCSESLTHCILLWWKIFKFKRLSSIVTYVKVDIIYPQIFDTNVIVHVEPALVHPRVAYV